jgi:hypothetical protein
MRGENLFGFLRKFSLYFIKSLTVNPSLVPEKQVEKQHKGIIDPLFIMTQ